MSESKFKTLRHIETVRNYLNVVIRELTVRQEQHDQSKLESPEVEIFEENTPKLRCITYLSEEYKEIMKDMDIAIKNHYKENRHHPEYFKNGIKDMTLVDLIEMICDWISSSQRHTDGDIFESIRKNKDRFNYSDETELILFNTACFLINCNPFHKANES
jgi:hypothetical protein